MNQSTINRLKSNPHFKPSPGLRQAMAEAPIKNDVNEDEEVQTFGQPPIHPTGFQTHPTGPRRVPNKRR